MTSASTTSLKLGPPPRRVRWRIVCPDLRVTAWRLCIGPLTLIGLLLFMGAPLRGWVAARGHEYEPRTTEITSSYVRRNASTPVLKYSYIAGGKEHFGSRQIKESQKTELFPPPGKQTVPIKVRAASFLGLYWDEVLLSGEGPLGPAFEGFAVGTGFGIVILMFTYMSHHRQFSPLRRLYKHGTAVQGRIVGKQIVRKKNKNPYRLDYEFEHPKFGTIKHFVNVSSPAWNKAYEGQPITVLMMPNRKRSVAYEYGDYVCL